MRSFDKLRMAGFFDAALRACSFAFMPPGNFRYFL
jgi:hypothetical protein